MYVPRRLVALIGVLLFSVAASNAQAQTVNCAGVAQWNQSTIYNPGDRLVFQNQLYEAVIQIWNAPPTHCPSCGWYRLLGTCGTVPTNPPPTVNLTSPANGATFNQGTAIQVAANAADSNGTVARVEFFDGATSIGVDTTSPFAITWSNAGVGSHTLTARATDNGNATTTSAAVTITVNATGNPPPTVNITSPANNSSFNQGVAIQVAANAADSNGTVVRVEFFDGTTSIGVDTTSPFAITWSNASPGSHSLTARATDNGNATTTSAAISVNIIGTCPSCGDGLPTRVLVGYWHNFNNGSGFIKLRDVSNDWDVINIAFGEPAAGSTANIQFTPDAATSVAEMQSDVQILHGRGKKVLLSVGGANGHVELRNATERTQFVNSVVAIIQRYDLDGLDIDFEGQSVHVNAGDSDPLNPTTPVIVNLISALREIRSRIGPDFILTMAPETFFVQVGYQFYGGVSGGDQRTGAYLPVIHAVRDILTLLHVQNYNSGSVTALDNRFYSMGNADFHVAMTEMLMTGFPIANTGRFFPGLRQDQVAFGLPANVNAGNGWTPVPEVQRALNYLIRGQSFGGQYVLRNPGGYRGMRGLMSWSINWDRFANFDFSRNHRIFLNALPQP